MRSFGKSHRRIRSLIVVIIMIISLISSLAIAETADSLIPDTSMWGISRDDLQKRFDDELYSCEVGKAKGLLLTGIDVDGYSMDAYYVFGEKTWNAKGFTYSGLSKITYILKGSSQYTDEDLVTCYQTFVGQMKNKAGIPESESSAVTTWEGNHLKIQIGKGKFKNYNNSDKTTIAIVFTGLNIAKPKTPRPTKKPTPVPTPKRTPKPTKTPKPVSIEYENALRMAYSYLNYTAFSFNGLVDQLEYEGFSPDACKYAAENCGADWKEQAVKMAKKYLDYTAFSKQGLIEQLEYEVFTHKQAVYGVEKNGY